MAKRISARKQKRIARVKKAIKTFERMAVGLVKIWLTDKYGENNRYIVAADQVDEFIREFTDK